MEQPAAQGKQRGRDRGIGRLVGFACAQPGRACGLLIGLHLLVWTLVPILVCRNLQLDLAEGLALGKEWQLGYWKLPPLPWWLDALAYRAAGNVRILYLLGPLACVVALYVVWRLGCRVASPQIALLAVVMLEGLHFFNYTAVKFNHDVLQLPLWSLTALFLHRAVVDGRSTDWILSGVWIALAFWTKYTVVALGAPIALLLLIDPFARRTWRTPGPWLMAAAFAVLVAPHLWWLVAHDFVPLHYADVRARLTVRWYEWIVFPLRWIGSQLLFQLPTLVVLALAVLGAPRARAPHESRADEAAAFARRYLTVMALGPFLLVTLGAALSGRLAIAMWGYPLWTLLPLAVLAWADPAIEGARLRIVARACLLVLLVVPAAYAADELFEPLLRDRPKATQFPGRLLAETVTRDWHETTGTPLTYVGGADFGASGIGEFAANTVAVYSPDRPHVVVHGEPRLSPWVDPADLDRRGAVFLWEPVDASGRLPANIAATFPRAELQSPLVLPRQTLYPRKPAVVNRAILRPRP
jgi:4-amino-4-deoxy-L-arabinose transferase-like glycosyltransferase